MRVPSLGELVWMDTPTKQLDDSEFDWPEHLRVEVAQVVHQVPDKFVLEPSVLIYVKRDRPLKKGHEDRD